MMFSPSEKKGNTPREKNHSMAFITTISENNSDIIQLESPPQGKYKPHFAKASCQVSRISTKTSITRTPSGGAKPGKPQRPTSVLTSSVLSTETESIGFSPKNRLLSASKFKFNVAESRPFPFFSYRSPSLKVNNFVEAPVRTPKKAKNKFLQKSQAILKDLVQLQQTGYDNIPKTKIKRGNKTALIGEEEKQKVLYEHLFPGQEEKYNNSPTVKEFISGIKEQIDCSKSKKVQDIMQVISDPEKGHSYLFRFGIASPKAIREKGMFESFTNNIDSYLVDQALVLKEDIAKKWPMTPKKTNGDKAKDSEPLLFSKSFNMKKFCKRRGCKSITETINTYEDKAWDIVLNEPHKIGNYLETGGDQRLQTLFELQSDISPSKYGYPYSPSSRKSFRRSLNE